MVFSYILKQSCHGGRIERDEGRLRASQGQKIAEKNCLVSLKSIAFTMREVFQIYCGEGTFIKQDV